MGIETAIGLGSMALAYAASYAAPVMIGAGIATGVTALAGGFSGGKGKGGGAPGMLPMPEAPKMAESRDRSEDISRKRKAASTRSVYTNPLGSGGQAGVIRKHLLGR